MARTHWTGHPFIDAGLAALAAAAGVDDLAELTPDRLNQAVQELQRILLSDQALGVGVDKNFAKGPLSQVFPNSELVNNSNWKGETIADKASCVRNKWREAVSIDLQVAQQCLQAGGGDRICSACGEKRHDEALLAIRKDKVPLLEGIVNFYPAFAYGVHICGLCALAVRFLPISVMRRGGGRRLWFLHTQSLEIAGAIAQIYGWRHFNSCIARNETLDFFGDWETTGEAGAVLYVLFSLLDTFADQVRSIYESPRPTTAYLFSNSNQKGFIQALPVPNELLRFLMRLQARSHSAYRRFWRELLHVSKELRGKERNAREGFVASIAQRIMAKDRLVSMCLDSQTPKLRGGWTGHGLYLEEVRRMPTMKLAILERLGVDVARSDDAKRVAGRFSAAVRNDLHSLFLRLVRRDFLTHEEFYALLPPNDYGAASEARDILLAVIYERQHCQEKGEEFQSLELESEDLTPDETLQQIQRIGQRLMDDLPNLSRWTGNLATARSPDGIRRAYLNAVRNRAMTFPDFIFLAPLGDARQHWLLRDYLLAFLLDRAPDIPLEDDIEEPAAAS